MLSQQNEDIYSNSKNGNYLLYYGERHSFDPEIKQWDEVRQLFNEWELKTRNSKRVSFIESKNIPSADTETDYIKKAGGSGFLTYLSKINNIEITSPEPDSDYEINNLLKLFSKKEISYYYTIRTIKQWLRYKDRPNLENYLKPYLSRIKDDLKLEEYNFNIFKINHLELFDFEFNEKDEVFINNSPNPIIEFNIINKVSKECTRIRDQHILETIFNYINNNYSIFIVYGRNHLITQRINLDTFFK